MITEIVTFRLKTDASLADTTSPASNVIRESLVPELAAQGADYVFYGQVIEKPEIGIVFVQRKSIEGQKKDTSSS